MKQNISQKINIFFVLCLLPWHTSFSGTYNTINSATTLEVQGEYIAYNDFPAIRNVIVAIINEAKNLNIYDDLSEGLRTCYESINNQESLVLVDSLLEAMPEILAYIENKTGTRAPRPEIGLIVGPCGCDSSLIIQLLKDIDNDLDECCARIQVNFNGTFTAINALNSLVETSTMVQRIFNLLNAEYCNPIIITQAYFDALPVPKTLPSGNYIFAENITYNPVAPGTAALTISQPQTSLDLGCFTLRQGNVVANTNGIQIANNANDVEIHNGIIRDFSNEGILFNSTSIERLYIHDISIVSVGQQGMRILAGVRHGGLDGTIENIEIMHTGTLVASPGSIVRGMGLFNCDNFKVDNIRITECGNTAVSWFQGMGLQACDNCHYSNLMINNNVAGTLLSGIGLFGCLNDEVNNAYIQGNQTFSFGSGLDGILMQPASGRATSNNQITQAYIITNTSSGFLNGIRTGFGCINNVFDDCRVINNISTGTTTSTLIDGFENSGSRNIYNECLALGNTALASPAGVAAIGFDMVLSTSNKLMYCIANDQLATTTSIGFDIAASGGTQLNECQAVNQTIGYEVTNASNPKMFKNFASANVENYRGMPIGSTQIAADISQINANLTNPWTNVAIG